MFVSPTLIFHDHDLFRVQMVSPVPEASKVFLARRETKDPEDSLDLLVQLGYRYIYPNDIKRWIFLFVIKKGHDEVLACSPQGLPGPAGEKGETGDVGQMVRV